MAKRPAEARVAGPLGPPRTLSGQKLVRAPPRVLAPSRRVSPYARPASAAIAGAPAGHPRKISPPAPRAAVEVAPGRRPVEVAGAPNRPITGVAEVLAAVMRRVDGNVWRLPAFATHGDRRLFKQQVAVFTLIRAQPARSLEDGVLGSEARCDIPDAEQRRRLVARVVSQKAGPEGANAAGALAAWKLLEAARERAGAAEALPARAAFVAAVIERERMRAASVVELQAEALTLQTTIDETSAGLDGLQKLLTLSGKAESKFESAG